MASCSLASLQAQACANGFFGLDPKSARAIELQLVKNLSGDTSTLAQLKTQACANGFLSVNENEFRIAQETLLFALAGCESPSEPETGCVNLILDGAVYDNTGRYYLRGSDGRNPPATILELGATYILTFGLNDSLVNNQSSGGLWLSQQGTYTFTYPGVGGDLGFYIRSVNAAPGIPVTATVCAVDTGNGGDNGGNGGGVGSFIFGGVIPDPDSYVYQGCFHLSIVAGTIEGSGFTSAINMIKVGSGIHYEGGTCVPVVTSTQIQFNLGVPLNGIHSPYSIYYSVDNGVSWVNTGLTICTFV
jgi:hypothetical protein